ncbi:MAG: Tetratricopeptide 2 repeat protein [Myxococcales bacterium]|nr:Tetratricopeptide 2 repeat protein [Myxococcales bacterium]
MSTEKDGTEVPPPPDPPEGVDSDVTHVAGTHLPGIGSVGDDDDEDMVTRVKSLADVMKPPERTAATEPTAARGVELQSVRMPPAMPHEGNGADNGDGEIHTMDDSDVETVDDDAVLEEDLDEIVPEGPSALDQAVADAQHLLGEGAHLRLVALYERELEALAHGEPDKARTALYQHEIGELTEARAGDEGAAVKAYARALQSDATLKPNLWAIRRVFERRALWPNLQKLLDAEIRFAKSQDERAELLVEKGELLEDRLNDPAGAVDCYNKAIEAHPQALAAWMALEKGATRDRDLAALGRIWRGLADATAEPGRKVALLIDLARLQESVDGGSPEQAQALLREALAIGVDAQRVLDELERQAERAGRTDDLLAVLDERAARLSARLAELPVEQRLAETDRLVALRRRQALLARERGEGERSWGYLQAALTAAPGEPLIARELAEQAASLGKWDELADLLAGRVEAAPAARKIGLRLERAEALRRAGKAAEADAVEAEVARDEPGHLGLTIARERTALFARDWERLATLWAAEAELANSDGTPTGKADVLWAATAHLQAAAAWEHLGRDTEAHKALQDALVLVPHFAAAVDALERLYARGGRHAEYVALLDAELGANPAATRAERLLENLIAAREALDDLPGAAQAARRLVELRPDDVRARVRLVELDRAALKLQEAADDLAELAKLLPEERRVEAMLERADLLEHRLNDPLGAAAAYREALALRPGDPRAAEAFEKLSRRRAKESGPHETPSPQAWDELAAALRREAQASLSPERIGHALLKLGEIHEKERGNWEDAAQAYRDLVDRAPGHAAALRGLARAYQATGDTPKRAEAMELEIEALAPAARGEALLRLGELYEDVLKQPDRADETFGRALDVEVNPHAALGRLRTAVREREPVALAEAIARLEPLVGGNGAGAAARAVLLDERADLAHKAGDVESAAARSDEAIALDASARLPWLSRARLAAQAGESAALGDALEALAERSTDPALQSALSRRAGLLALSSGSRATRTEAAAQRRLRQSHALTPSDSSALVALCAVVVDPDALGARAKLAEGAAQLEWHLEHGESLEAVGRLGEAAQAAQRALELDGHHVGALELARRLARLGGDDKSYAATTARLAAEVLEGERAAGFYREAAETFERVGADRDAAAAWRAVLDRTPLDGNAFNRARDLLHALHIVEKSPGPLVELYTHRLEHVRGADDRVRMFLERAKLYGDAGDRDHAEKDLRAALELDPDEPEALRRLAELVAALPTGRDEAIALFARYLEDVEDATRRREALLRVAELQEEAGQVDEAVHRLEEAIKLAPTPAEARGEHEKLAQLLVRQRQWQKAVEALRRLSELLPDGPSRAAVEIRVATIYREGFSDPRAAVEALLRALRSDPMSMDALARLMPLADAGHVLPMELEEKLERAIDAARGDAEASPLSIEPYQALVRLWGWRGDDDCRLMAAQAEAIVGNRAVPGRENAVEPTKELSSQSWQRLWPEVAVSVAMEVWHAAGESTVALYGPTLEALGVGKRDRVNAKGTPLAWIPVDKIGRSLTGSHFGYELYTTQKDICVATGKALVCGPQFADKLSPAMRFRVARRIALLREGLGAIDSLDDEELAIFFAAAARVAELAQPPSLGALPTAKVEDRARALGKAIARKEKKALQAIGARLAMLPPAKEWRAAVLEGAARAALAVGGDLQAALAELDLRLQRDRLAQSLTRFAVSDDFRVLRRDMGLKG